MGGVPFIQPLVSRDHHAHIEQFLDAPPADLSHSAAQRRFAAQAQQCRGQCRGISRRYQKPRCAVQHHLRVAADARGRHSQAACHRLQQRQRNPFREGRQHEQAGPRQQVWHVAHLAEKRHRAAEFQLFGRLPQRRHAHAIPSDFQAERRIVAQHQGGRLQKRVHVFFRTEPGDGDCRPVRVVGDAEAVHVDAVADEGRLAPADALGDRHARAILRDADETVGEQGEHVDTEALPARQALGETVVSCVNDARDSGEEGCRRGVEMRPVVVRMNDIGFPLAEQACEPQHQGGMQSGRRLERPHRTAERFEILGQNAPAAEGNDQQLEATALDMTRELDEQFFLPADVQSVGDMNHAQAPASSRHRTPAFGPFPKRLNRQDAKSAKEKRKQGKQRTIGAGCIPQRNDFFSCFPLSSLSSLAHFASWRFNLFRPRFRRRPFSTHERIRT